MKLTAAILIAFMWLAILPVQFNFLPNYLFMGGFRADLTGLLFLNAVGWSLLVIGYGLFSVWFKRQINKTSQQQQQNYQTAHRQFIQRLDHEIKNPLAVLRVGLSNLQETQSVERLGQQVQRLQKLLEDLRYLTEIETYQLDINPVNLQEVLEDAIELTRQEGRSIQLHIQEIPWTLSPIPADQDLLLVAFRNVLDNALKFTTPANKIEIRAVEDKDHVIVEIADTGMGIPDEDLPLIFEDLYRGKNARNIPGSGLGLTLVRRIMTLHKGSIDIRTKLGQGTVVRLTLPGVKDAV